MKINNAITQKLNRLAKLLQRAFPLFAAVAPVPPGPASTPNINALLLHLCDGDHARATWVLRWLAYPLRKPGAKMATAVVMHGTPGTGKSLFFEGVAAAMHGDEAVKPGHRLNSVFNDWMANHRFALVDEQPRYELPAERMKELITCTHVQVQRKGKPPTMTMNQMNFVFLSGDMNALADLGNRRFMVLRQDKPLAPSLAAAVSKEIQSGGVEDFRAWLVRQLDIDDFNERTSARVAA